MNANDWIKILTDREQRLTAILDQFRTSNEPALQLIATKIGPLLEEVVEMTEKLFCHGEQPEDQ